MLENFKGTIDELLAHTSSLNVKDFDKEPLGDEEALDIIQKDFHVDREEAKLLLEEIKIIELSEILTSLEMKGLIEMTGYDDDGMPTYRLKGS